MRFGAVIPFADEREFTELATVAEEAGWDMVFSWEAVWGQDAWATLAAAAMVTERVRLGTLLTPAARYRPWDLASRVASVDRLSAGPGHARAWVSVRCTATGSPSSPTRAGPCAPPSSTRCSRSTPG